MLHRPAGRDASSGQDVHRYERHRSDQSILYRFVEQHHLRLWTRWPHKQAQDEWET
jgi:hypothetical protein